MKGKLTTLGPLLVLAGCVDLPVQEGSTTQSIVGGSTASTTEFPTVVALQHGSGNFFCTGVLVDKDWVLSSAYCFAGNNDATQARFDDGNLRDGNTSGRTINITEKHIHPSFNTNNWGHDVAVLKLATSMTDRTATPVKRDTMGMGTTVQQAGFGARNNNGDDEGVLRTLTTSNVNCSQVGLSDSMFLCFDASDGSGSCYGDGGAPAFTMGGTREVVGLGSGGTGNDCTSGFDVYTALSAELSFIDQFVPHTTPPPDETTPPDDTTTPPPSDDPRDPKDDDDDGSGNGPPAAVGCSAAGGNGVAMVLSICLAGVMAVRRRRRR